MCALISLIGKVFGWLTVIRELPPRINASGFKSRMFECLCKCGNTTQVRYCNLTQGTTKSCGCLHRQKLAEPRGACGHARKGKRSKTYMVWATMIARGTKEHSKGFARYGAVGRTVCERWMSFENFLADKGEAPPGMTIERIDNNGIYEPSNCKWDTWKNQARNRSNNRVFTAGGITACLAELCEHFGQKYSTVVARFDRYGWTIEQALMTPPGAKPRAGDAPPS